MSQDDRKYTDPELRKRLKEEIQASDKGGRKGQWSARKSQLLAQRYEREGGGYRGPKDERQRSLDRWTAQDWQTIDASGDAEDHGEMHRYLPKKAWAMLTESQRREADRSKVKEDEAGRQYVAWPEAVRDAMTVLGETGDDLEAVTKKRLQEFARQLGIEGRSKMDRQELARAIREAEGEPV